MLDPQLLEIAPPGPGGTFPPSELLPHEVMLRPLDTVRQHLQIALLAIEVKRPWLDRRWAYYLGHHSERVLSTKLSDVIAKQADVLSTMFTNYCGLAVEAPLARLKVSGWKGDQSQVEKATELWEENDLDVDGEEVHRTAMVAGDAYVIVWPRVDAETDADTTGDSGQPVYDIALQDSRNMYVHYGSRRRRDRQWGAKIWLDADIPAGHYWWRAVIYYRDEIVRLVGMQPASLQTPCPRDPNAFQLDMQEPGGQHNLGAVPVVRFARAWDGRSKLEDIIPIQDRINKLTADKIVAAEFGAFPQRWVLTNDDPPPGALRPSPGGLWVIPPASTSPDANEDAPTTVGQFALTELSNYDGTIQTEVNALFTIAQLPRHLLINPGVAPSGEAIKADEGPMVANVRGYRDMFAASWRDVMQLCGVDVEAVFGDVEVHNELTAAQTFRELTTSGMPLRMAAEFALDLPEEELDELDALPLPPQPGAAVPGQAATPPGQQQGMPAMPAKARPAKAKAGKAGGSA
jgi:Phage portal protein, SPP1 Gp6-like